MREARPLVENDVEVERPRAKALAALRPPEGPLPPRFRLSVGPARLPSPVMRTLQKSRLPQGEAMGPELQLLTGMQIIAIVQCKWQVSRACASIVFRAASSSRGASEVSASSAAFRNAGCSVTYAGALSYSRDSLNTCAHRMCRSPYRH